MTTTMTIFLPTSILLLFAVIAVATATATTNVYVYGSTAAIGISNPADLPTTGLDATINLNITFANKTTASIINQTITQYQGNDIVVAVSSIISGYEFEYTK
jgi:hypothetical protein